MLYSRTFSLNVINILADKKEMMRFKVFSITIQKKLHVILKKSNFSFFLGPALQSCCHIYLFFEIIKKKQSIYFSYELRTSKSEPSQVSANFFLLGYFIQNIANEIICNS